MSIWMIPVILAGLGIMIVSLSRLKISRDINREKDMDDPEVSQSYASYSRSLILSTERRLALGALLKYRPRGILLDAGCGPGHIDMQIIQEIPDINLIGLDISQNMLKIARQNFTAKDYAENVFLCKGDAHHLPLKTGSIDFVFSSGSLHHWPDPKKVFQELHRVLKPGGRFLIFDLRRDIPRLSYAVIWLMQKFTMPEPMRLANGAVGSIWSAFTPEEIKLILKSSPFNKWDTQKSWGWFYIRGQKSD